MGPEDEAGLAAREAVSRLLVVGMALLRRLRPANAEVLVLDFGLLAVGVAGMTAASFLQLRRYPNEPIGRWSRLDRQTTGLGLVSLVIAVFGGASAQRHLGWWIYVLAFALFIAAGEVPRLLHNREVDRRQAQLGAAS